MPTIIDHFDKAVIGFDVVFVVFLLASIFIRRRNRPRSLTISGVPLPVKSAAALLALLSFVALIDGPIYRKVARTAVEATIPSAGTARISILIPDFYGDGGAGIADQVRETVQAGLGSGVQV